MMLADVELWRSLSEKIADLRERAMTLIMNGGLNLEDYKRHAGYVKALDDVIRAAQDAHDEITGRGRSKENPEEPEEM